jgi:hypothetical protein
MEICGELTEYLEVTDTSGAPTEAMKKELGDLCYSLAMLPDSFGLTVTYLGAPYLVPTEYRFQRYGNLQDDGPSCVGKMQEVLKKIIRDDNWKLTNEDRKNSFLYYLSSLYTYVVTECEIMNWNLSDVLILNVEKLQDRLSRGKILGDGDER